MANLTPLHHAARDGQSQIVSRLCGGGSNKDDAFCGMTALHFAAERGRVEDVRFLRGARAAMNRTTGGPAMQKNNQFNSFVINVTDAISREKVGHSLVFMASSSSYS